MFGVGLREWGVVRPVWMEISRAERGNREDRLRPHLSRGHRVVILSLSLPAQPGLGRERSSKSGIFLPLSHLAPVHWGLSVSPCGQPGAKLCSRGSCDYTSWVSGPPGHGRQGWGQIRRSQAGTFAPLEENVATRIAIAMQRPSHISYVDAASWGLCSLDLTLCRNSPRRKALSAPQG